MWSRKFYHSFAQLSTGVIRGICEDKGKYATFQEVEPFWCSSSQTRRPTNWATPGYLIRKKCSLWSNMWSKKLYHSFAGLSTEVIRGICEDKGEYATFGAVEPFWCSSSQTRRPTNWATPGSIRFASKGVLDYASNCVIIQDKFAKCNQNFSCRFAGLPLHQTPAGVIIKQEGGVYE